jgi:hypothetical protein
MCRRKEVLSLYRSMLRTAHDFKVGATWQRPLVASLRPRVMPCLLEPAPLPVACQDYNFRYYFTRRIKDEFRQGKQLVGQAERVAKLMTEVSSLAMPRWTSPSH